MDKFVKIDGGIGRCIAATGAVEAYALEEATKGNKTYVVTSFPYVFEGIDAIERVYPFPGTPYIYEEHIKRGEFLEPEPYNDVSYYLEEKHLAQVFNKLLNGKDEFVQPKFILSDNELMNAKLFCENQRKETGKKVLLYQPWGSSGGKGIPDKEKNEHKIFTDESYRSFGTEFARRLCNKLSEDYVVYMIKTDDQLGFKDAMALQNSEVRKVIALIPFVDGIVCCDSFLHHASAALGSPVPTVVLWAGTNEKNLGYKEQTNIKSWKKVEYEPNRIPHDHAYYVNKNKASNEFKVEVIDEIVEALRDGNKKAGMDGS